MTKLNNDLKMSELKAAEAACRLFRTPIHVYRFGRWMKRD